MSSSFVEQAPFVPRGAHAVNNSLNTMQTITIPATANCVLMQARGAAVRYTFDGSDPTAGSPGNGFELTPAMGVIRIPLAPGSVIEAIQEAAGASLQIQFIRVN
jgi:hypothetical protein